jgi:hypothetical protein
MEKIDAKRGEGAVPHLEREMLAAVARGEIPPQALVEIAWNHLLEVCPTCREEVAAWRRAGGPQEYREAFARLQAGLRAEEERAARQRAEARAWLAVLLPLPQEERRARLARARRRFRGRAFAEVLLEAARARLPGHPAESADLAELAQEAAFRSPLSAGEGAALAAQALALQGDARRALGRPEEADSLLGAAREVLAEAPAADPLVAAEVDHLEGTLRKDQRLAAALGDPGEAAEAFAEVRAFFAEAEEALDHAAAGLDLVLLHLQAGRWDAVREVAAETVAFFGAHGAGGEVLAALVLFRQGAEEEALTAAWVQELARYLERARTDPGARFEEPS